MGETRPLPYGVIRWEDLNIGIPTLWWWFPEMTASFILFSIVIGVIGQMSELTFTNAFVDGARDLLGVTLIIGIARGITGIMNLFIPTSAVVMGGLAIARVPYGAYLRWVWPLLAMLVALSVVGLGVGALLS